MRLSAFFGFFGAFCLAAGLPAPASAHDLTIDTSAAHAVLDALGNPALTAADAHRIAEMPANQEMIRKVASYGNGGDEAMFERELLAVAHGMPQAKEHFFFSRVKDQLPDVQATLSDFEKNRDSNVRWILDRVQKFSPPGPPLHLKGYILGGGAATGFAFGGPEFFLRISDFVGAPDYLRVIMAHELYHAVVGAARDAAHKPDDFDEERLTKIKAKPARDAYAVRGILDQLLNEGSATYVGDPLLTDSKARLPANERDRIRNADRLPKRLPTLLDMALVGVTATKPLNFADVYGVGFYADQPLYYLGYAMVRAIAANDGDSRIGTLNLQNGCDFATEYLRLAAADRTLPKLGDASVSRIRMACASR